MAAVKELCVQIDDEPGALGVVSGALGRAGINIDGFGVWDGCARLLVDDVESAQRVLREEGFACSAQRVLRLDLPDQPGNLADVAAAGFDHVLATRLHRDPDVAAVLAAAAGDDTVWVPAGGQRTACEVTHNDRRHVVVDSPARRARTLPMCLRFWTGSPRWCSR